MGGWVYKCRGCGWRQPIQWRTRCPNCNRFYNSPRIYDRDVDDKVHIEEGALVSLCDVAADISPRTPTMIEGLDRILGKNADGIYGFRDGQISMLYGNAGSGKSTLVLQVAMGIAKQREDIVYIAGEESLEDIKERADRLGTVRKNLMIVAETDLDKILDILEEIKPKAYIVDSLQTIESGDFRAGSVGAVSAALAEFKKFSKRNNVAVFLICQISRSGEFKGPQSLAHDIDTQLHMINFGDMKPRRLECIKNRKGSITHKAHFRMTEKGLIEVYIDDDETKELDKEALALEAANRQDLRSDAI